MNSVDLTVLSRTYSVNYNDEFYLVTTNFYCNEDERKWIVLHNGEDEVHEFLSEEIINFVKSSHNVKGSKM